MPKFSMKHTRLTFVAFLVVVLFFAVFVAYKMKKVEKFEEKVANTVKIVLVYAAWCPHCEDYLKTGMWDKVSKEIPAKPEFKDKVSFDKVDYDKDADAAKRYNVQSFPSIVAVRVKDGKTEVAKLLDFKGNRDSMAELEDFAAQSLIALDKAVQAETTDGKTQF